METLYFITKYLSYDTRAFSKIREFQREFLRQRHLSRNQAACNSCAHASFVSDVVESTWPIATAGLSFSSANSELILAQHGGETPCCANSSTAWQNTIPC